MLPPAKFFGVPFSVWLSGLTNSVPHRGTSVIISLPVRYCWWHFAPVASAYLHRSVTFCEGRQTANIKWHLVDGDIRRLALPPLCWA
jgi:hypothetical protein